MSGNRPTDPGVERRMTSGGRGYVATVLGSVVGGAAGVGIGLQIAGWYVDRYMPFAEMEAIEPAVWGIVLGAGAGGGLGSWAALRIRGYRGGAVTGGLVAVAIPALAVGLGFLVNALGFELPLTLFVALPILTATLAARAVVVLLGADPIWDDAPGDVPT